MPAPEVDMAPTPKPEGMRVRRNAGQKNWVAIERGAVKAPPMPGATSIKDSAQRRLAQAYWKAIWADLGAIFTDADRFPLARLCKLHAQAMLGKLGAQLQTELRQLEQSFGSNPIGRMRLMIQVVDAAEGSTGTGPAVADLAKVRERKARAAARRGPVE
jgi:hypothetical protein